MAWGNSVTELNQIGVGTVGYAIRVDTTSLLAYKITGVQAQSSASDTPAPATEEVDLMDLMAYLNDTSAPDLAFNYGFGEVHIFFKTSVFAYDAATRFSLFGKRNPIKVATLGDKLDIADRDVELFLAYAIKHAALMTGNPIPFQVEKTIRQKELEITNANS